MKYTIEHDTVYQYDGPVRGGIQYLRLTPRDSHRQQVLRWDLNLPEAARLHWDAYGNLLHVVTFDNIGSTLTIHAEGEVWIDTTAVAEKVNYSPLPYLRTTGLTTMSRGLCKMADQVSHISDSRVQMESLMHNILEVMPYTPNTTHAQTTAADALEQGLGVCQDHTHVFLACARHLGIPARYVSGYLYTSDHHVASHAWAEACIGDAWYTFDVSNQLTKPERHIKLAIGMDYLDSCPVRGVRSGGGGEILQAQVVVAPAGQ